MRGGRAAVVAARRAVLVWQSILGGLDDAGNLAEQSSERLRQVKELTRLLVVQQRQTIGWCSLWMQASREHAAAQSHMIEVIDDLRRQLGTYDGKSHLEHQMAKDFADKHLGDRIPAPEGSEVPEGLKFPPPKAGEGVQPFLETVRSAEDSDKRNFG